MVCCISKRKPQKITLRTSFEEMLHSDRMKEQFHAHLAKNHSSEAFTFVLDVMAFKEGEKDNDIFNTYLSMDAHMPVSVGNEKELARVRSIYYRVMSEQGSLPLDLFDYVFLEVKDSVETKFNEYKSSELGSM
eukprot:TRINITY_DN7511_c0_g1_i1.p1 TRINITY_DN7511_c0_g1~~TRINITY_DN7511_c0_g1_i1.p1  ORF type:complete len:148 (-),score=29.53 TRINITY_DN7511_c0_g1_i1:88-486(-)